MIKWIAEAASQPLSKPVILAAIKKFKPVSLGNYTAFKDGVVSLTVAFKGDQVTSTAIFRLTPEGSKFTMSNLEVMAEIPGVREAGWKKIKLLDATGTLNQVITGVVGILRDRAAKGVTRPRDSGGGLPKPTPKAAPAPKAPTSAQSIEAAIKALEAQRAEAVKDFDARIEQLRNSHPSTTGKKAASGALYGVDSTSMKAVFTRLFSRPVPASRKLSVKAGSSTVAVEITHLVSNNVMLVDIPTMGNRQYLAVKGEGMWREDDSNLPAQYKKYL